MSKNLAMAVHIQRKNRKKLAQGGEVKKESPKDIHEAADQEKERINQSIEDQMRKKQAAGKPGYAKGGMIDTLADTIADRIMSKRQKMAEGGEVDLEANAEEEGRSPYDRRNAEIANDPIYDLDQLDDQPEDSNLFGDEEEKSSENKHDRIAAIRKRMRAKRA